METSEKKTNKQKNKNKTKTKTKTKKRTNKKQKKNKQTNKTNNNNKKNINTVFCVVKIGTPLLNLKSVGTCPGYTCISVLEIM